MKIPAHSFQLSEQYAVIHQAPRYQVHHFALAFQHAMHGQQPGCGPELASRWCLE